MVVQKELGHFSEEASLRVYSSILQVCFLLSFSLPLSLMKRAQTCHSAHVGVKGQLWEWFSLYDMGPRIELHQTWP